LPAAAKSDAPFIYNSSNAVIVTFLRDGTLVSNNTSKYNSGGILLSDDTGATHDNLITDNVVMNNPFDCGITPTFHKIMLQGSA
jgi:hypothetical protein